MKHKLLYNVDFVMTWNKSQVLKLFATLINFENFLNRLQSYFPSFSELIKMYETLKYSKKMIHDVKPYRLQVFPKNPLQFFFLP
jgi:hypothetical protein